MNPVDLLLSPLGYEFFVRALVASALTWVFAGMLLERFSDLGVRLEAIEVARQGLTANGYKY